MRPPDPPPPAAPPLPPAPPAPPSTRTMPVDAPSSWLVEITIPPPLPPPPPARVCARAHTHIHKHTDRITSLATQQRRPLHSQRTSIVVGTANAAIGGNGTINLHIGAPRRVKLQPQGAAAGTARAVRGDRAAAAAHLIRPLVAATGLAPKVPAVAAKRSAVARGPNDAPRRRKTRSIPGAISLHHRPARKHERAPIHGKHVRHDKLARRQHRQRRRDCEARRGVGVDR